MANLVHKQIALIGECMIELNGEPFGAMQQTYGGDSLNTAVYLARLAADVDVQYVSALGVDALSRGMRERWQEEGVGTQWVLEDAARQAGIYLIQLDSRGERTFLYWRNQSAARYLLQHPQMPQVWQGLAGADYIYLSGISLAILPEDDRQALIEGLGRLAASGVKIIFDGNYRPKLWQSAEETRACYQALLKYVSLALMTYDDEKLLWGDEDAQASLARLQAVGVAQIVIKVGAEGAIYCDEGEYGQVPTQKIAQVVDTTAAGDSFNAGFLAAYLQERSMQQCCEQGNRLAGIVIGHKGAIIPARYCRL